MEAYEVAAMNSKHLTKRPRKKKKRSLIDRIITNLIGVIGALALLYPLVSNFYAAWTQDNAANRYEQIIKKSSDADKQKAEKFVQKYNNDALHGQVSAFDTTTPYADPFVALKQQRETEKAKQVREETIEKKIHQNMIGDLVGTLTIPKINQRLPIFAGTTEQALSRGVGLVNGTSIPYGGKGVNSIIAGHRGLIRAEVFRHLDKMELGDIFFADSNGRKYAYKVDNITVVSPTEATNYKIDKDKNYMTLMTCTPYMINSHRLLVRGYQVPITKVPKAWPAWVKPLVWILMALCLLLLLLWLVNRRKKTTPIVIQVFYPHPFIQKGKQKTVYYDSVTQDFTKINSKQHK